MKSSQPTLGSEVSKIKFRLPVATSPILRHLEQITPTGRVQKSPETTPQTQEIPCGKQPDQDQDQDMDSSPGVTFYVTLLASVPLSAKWE